MLVFCTEWLPGGLPVYIPILCSGREVQGVVWSKRAARQASSFTHAPGKASSSREPWASAQTLWARAHAGPACLAAGDLPGRLASVTAPRGLPLLRSVSCSRGAPSTRLTVKGPLSFPLCRQAGLPCMQPPPVHAASSRALCHVAPVCRHLTSPAVSRRIPRLPRWRSLIVTWNSGGGSGAP